MNTTSSLPPLCPTRSHRHIHFEVNMDTITDFQDLDDQLFECVVPDALTGAAEYQGDDIVGENASQIAEALGLQSLEKLICDGLKTPNFFLRRFMIINILLCSRLP